MLAYGKWTAIVLLASALGTGSAATYAQHTDGHSDGHTGGHSGGKKGPRYMGGFDRSHSSAAHKGGSSHHDASEGGSKSVEGKIFHTGSGGHDTSHDDGSTEHTH